MHALRALALALLACALPAGAQDTETEDFGPPESGPRRHSLFWGGFDLGYASLARSYSTTSRTREGTFTMALRGGIALDPRLLLGVELGGWTIGNSDLWDPSKGEAISTRFLIAQYAPLPSSSLFVRVGGGRIRYWNNRPGEDGASGSGGIVGVGFDLPLAFPANGGVALYLTPSVDYSFGGFKGATSPPGVVQDQRYRAAAIRIGVTLR